MAKIKKGWLLALEHQAQQSLLQMIFHVAYGQGADPHRPWRVAGMQERGTAIVERAHEDLSKSERS